MFGPCAEDLGRPCEIGFFHAKRDVLLFQLRHRFEQRSQRARFRFAQYKSVKAVRQRLKLRLEVERLGEVKVTEERNDLPAKLTQRVDEMLHFGQQHIGSFQSRHSVAKRKLKDTLSAKRGRVCSCRTPDEFIHQCGLANA